MYMLIMVLDDIAHLNNVLAAWVKAGARGVTILESTGLHRVMLRHKPEAAYAGFSRMFGSDRVGHKTLFAIIDDMAIAEAVAAATEQVVGDLNEPHRGILFALPVVKAWGLASNETAAGTGRVG
ncbi:MAG: hypothetical protein H3C69_07110 [Candidatus Promineofilum sp.]|nr:hypothetical protein [Promineifilum sp.]